MCVRDDQARESRVKDFRQQPSKLKPHISKYLRLFVSFLQHGIPAFYTVCIVKSVNLGFDLSLFFLTKVKPFLKTHVAFLQSFDPQLLDTICHCRHDRWAFAVWKLKKKKDIIHIYLVYFFWQTTVSMSEINFNAKSILCGRLHLFWRSVLISSGFIVATNVG